MMTSQIGYRTVYEINKDLSTEFRRLAAGTYTENSITGNMIFLAPVVDRGMYFSRDRAGINRILPVPGFKHSKFPAGIEPGYQIQTLELPSVFFTVFSCYKFSKKRLR